MKIILSALLAFISIPVMADTPVYVHLTSATSQGMNISTNTATRVDNYNGVGEGLMSLRNQILVENQDTTYSIWCAFDANVSSITGNADAGRELKAGKIFNIAMDYRMSYYCYPADGAGNNGVNLHVEQGTEKESIHEN